MGIKESTDEHITRDISGEARPEEYSALTRRVKTDVTPQLP